MRPCGSSPKTTPSASSRCGLWPTAETELDGVDPSPFMRRWPTRRRESGHRP